MRRLLDRIRRRDTRTPSVPATQTVEAVIPPISIDLVADELKEWARATEVDVERPIDGIWWHRGAVEEDLRQVRAGVGWVGLQFHGGGYMLGSAKDVLSGGSRACTFSSIPVLLADVLHARVQVSREG